ncbi:FG-GAP-like repeat-containing protein [Lysobacter sp. 5GHs7-4]|uniref:FG-GAP repeat domain-containing protein n=1 Tax=Lysobacter sp. 5GHs7-4 TaxID=2904253 RepID=UPI001E456A23|nr:FG-GAP-like repeat-containing protein [Lysobacter sp. 5GHs7-4]UHQ22680.1 FG-GAP-like repeat-containing protein [Lysobacter sp. 5GHs7-4]
MRNATLVIATALTLLCCSVTATAAQAPAGYTPWRFFARPLASPASSVPFVRPPLRQPASTAKAGIQLTSPGKHNDINGDGRSDLIWYTYFSPHTIPAYWYLSYWQMDGASVPWAHNFLWSSSLDVPFPGDFDGNGRSDLLFPGPYPLYSMWLSRSDGSFDTRPVSNIGMPAGNGWKLTYLPNDVDLNADGRDDLLIYNTSAGKGAYVLMDGPSVLESITFDLSPGYAISGGGDFDGDGLDDLLCSHAGLGYLFLWRNRGDGGFDVSFIAAYAPGWAIVGNPDLNGDGHADIVWSQQALNMLGFWWMDGGSVIRMDSKWAGPRPRVATGDFDGDGIGDVVWTQQVSPYYSFLWRSRGDGEFDAHLLAQVNEYWRSAY